MIEVEKAVQKLTENKITVDNDIKFCVYALFDEDELVYIGKSKQVEARIFSHCKSEKQFDSYGVYECDSELYMDCLESNLIMALKPKYNVSVGSEFVNIKKVREKIRALGEEYKYNPDFYIPKIRKKLLKEDVELFGHGSDQYIKHKDLLRAIGVLTEGESD